MAGSVAVFEREMPIPDLAAHTSHSYEAIAPPINGDAEGKNLLSIRQLTAQDIGDYVGETQAAEEVLWRPHRRDRGIDLLPFTVLKAVMQQPSTRTGGSMTSAMAKLGGHGELYSGMQSSSEAKGESPAHTWVAFNTQTDMLGLRTKTNHGPYEAARAIAESFNYGKLREIVPVINLGNGTDEHPTQALGDIYLMAKKNNYDIGALKGQTLVVVGDHERYRAIHSLMLAAAKLSINIMAVESEVAPVPEELVRELGSSLVYRTTDLDEAMEHADFLYVGRNPDEYDGDNDPWEELRSRWLADTYRSWLIDHDRLQIMKPDGVVLHPRPIKNELHPSVESDPRMQDVLQMEVQWANRMGIIARHAGESIKQVVQMRKAFPLATNIPRRRAH